MTLTLDISDDLKPEEARELVNLAMEEKKPVGVLILEAARERVRQRRERGLLMSGAEAHPNAA